jgi:hypothetical protein
MRNDIQERTGFTDYGLAGQDGTARPLTELRGDNLMVLHLSRGAANPRSTTLWANRWLPQLRIAAMSASTPQRRAN